jgi:hypothetical protein
MSHFQSVVRVAFRATMFVPVFNFRRRGPLNGVQIIFPAGESRFETCPEKTTEEGRERSCAALDG